jgi:hypothetical protein
MSESRMPLVHLLQYGKMSQVYLVSYGSRMLLCSDVMLIAWHGTICSTTRE